MLNRIKSHLRNLRYFTTFYRDWQAERTIRASGEMNAEWYLNNNPDVKSSKIDPVKHYVRYGALEGRNPAPLFNTTGYMTANADVASAKMNPLLHYILYGKAEGRLFEPSTAPSPAPTTNNKGAGNEVDLINSSGFFDSNWYREQYQISNDVDPVVHFVKTGWRHMFDPSPKFSTKNYLDYYRDVKAAGINPLTHFLKNGEKEGRHPLPPKRIHNSPFPRLTPDEIGTPDIVLHYDDKPKRVMNISKEKICVHVHLFHVDMLDEIARYLSHINHRFTLLVSIPTVTIKTDVLEDIGYFDEIAFPRGYGEENDFCFRAENAGHILAIAIDTFIFHAKSKSYTSSDRIQFMNDGMRKLSEKHGVDRIKKAVAFMEENPHLMVMRDAVLNKWLAHYLPNPNEDT